jgi:hypothetical protein
MARCTKCGTVAPAMARFCPICGTAVGPAAPPPTNNQSAGQQNAPYVPRQAAPAQSGGYAPQPSYTAPKRKNAALFAALLGVGAMGIAGVLLVKSGVLGAKPTSANGGVLDSPSTQAQSPILSAPNTQAQAPVMAAPPVGAPPSNVIAPPGNPGNAMPDDVIEYLRWLKRFHAGLGALNSQLEQVTLTIFPNMLQGIMNQVSEDDNTPKGPNPEDPTAKMAEITQKLNNAAGMFQQKQPPNACAPLAQSYNTSLTVQVQQVQSMISMLGDITRSFSNTDVNAGANDRMQKLTGLMQQKNSKGLSQQADALVLASDAQLNSLRARYTNIPADIDAAQFQVKPLNSGFDPSKLMGGGGGLGIPGL